MPAICSKSSADSSGDPHGRLYGRDRAGTGRGARRLRTLGTALTLEQARLLKRYAPEIWVSYDGDAAGQHAILRALDIFEEEGVPARVLDFPGGMDPDEYIKTYGPQSVEQLKPTDATAYHMKQEAANHDLSTEEGRTAYAIACAKYLAKVKEPVELENYVKQLMVSTGFTREVLLAQIGRTELIEENKRPMFRHAARPLGGEKRRCGYGNRRCRKGAARPCWRRAASSRGRSRRTTLFRRRGGRWRKSCWTA